jgi:O-methyltransferase
MMKDSLHKVFKLLGLTIRRYREGDNESRLAYFNYKRVYTKYADRTMIPFEAYIDNLKLAEENGKNINGAVVECGVWKGGMIAGISELLGGARKYYLFDSYEGLPDASDKDGESAKNWQNNKTSEHYYDNCCSTEEVALDTMSRSGVNDVHSKKGWFSDTLPSNQIDSIAILRLDGDWFESTYTCLKYLYPKVVDNGIIIIDDYYFWDGCTKAVHQYLTENNLSDRIKQTEHGVAYIVKNEFINRFQKNPD